MVQNIGQTIGEIKDIYYDPLGKTVLGFIVEEKGWFKGAKIIKIDDVQEITSKAIFIADVDVILDTNDCAELNDNIEARVDLRGFKMVKDNGQELGVICDLLIETENNFIYGYEISDGVINDLLLGRTSVMVSGNIAVKDNLVVMSAN